MRGTSTIYIVGAKATTRLQHIGNIKCTHSRSSASQKYTKLHPYLLLLKVHTYCIYGEPPVKFTTIHRTIL